MSEAVAQLLENTFGNRPHRIIYDQDGTSPYLSRWYLRGAPRMDDGSSPYDPWGNPRERARFPKGTGLYVHKFHRSDKDRELHNHPWAWGVSLILAGGYREERRVGSDVVVRTFRPGMINRIGQNDFHRVELLEKEAWTLFCVGEKVSSWGFWDRATGEYVDWRTFLARKQGMA